MNLLKEEPQLPPRLPEVQHALEFIASGIWNMYPSISVAERYDPRNTQLNMLFSDSDYNQNTPPPTMDNILASVSVKLNLDSRYSVTLTTYQKNRHEYNATITYPSNLECVKEGLMINILIHIINWKTTAP